MTDDIYALPVVEISEEEDRIFSSAEYLLRYLQLYGAKLSREGLTRHLEHMGVTEAQLPALMDTAQTKGLILGEEDAAQGQLPEEVIRAMGAFMMQRAERNNVRMTDVDRAALELLFGLRDGVPRTIAETAELLDVSPGFILWLEERMLRRLSRTSVRRKRIRDFYA